MLIIMIPKAKKLKLVYSMNVEQRLKIKKIHEYASGDLRSWSPLFPSCEAFIMRITS